MVRTFSGRLGRLREHFPPIEKVADVSDAQRIEDLSDVPDATREEMRAIRDAARQKNEETPVALEGPFSCVLWCCCGSTVRDPFTRQREFIPE